jgi:hypothetical protein
MVLYWSAKTENPLLGSRYVERMVRLFYKSDEAVKHDLELQAWCREITDIGLQGAQDGRQAMDPPQ